jgi:calcium-dependent protein kinase
MVGSSYYIAPEVLKQSYGHECDMWSTGVVAYMLMSGSPPFEGANEDDLFHKVMSEDISFDKPAFAAVSEEAKDFMRYVLTRDVSQRPSPSAALEHPWLAQLDKAARLPVELRDTSVDSLLKFADQPHLRRAALVLMGGGASNKIFRDAQGAFLDLDLTGSGTISLQSFEKHLLERDPDIDQIEIRQTFSKLDVHKNGEIHYSEFLGAYHEIALSESEDAIRRAFTMFDSDKSGFITKENLKEVFTGQLSKEKELVAFERMLHEAGCSDSRGMNLEDFARMVKNPRHVPKPKLSTKLRRTGSDRSDRTVTADDAGIGFGAALSALRPGDACASPSTVSRTPTLHHEEICRMESVKALTAPSGQKAPALNSGVSRTPSLFQETISRMESVKSVKVVTASMSAVGVDVDVLHDTIVRMESAKSIVPSSPGQKPKAFLTDTMSRMASGQRTMSFSKRISI